VAPAEHGEARDARGFRQGDARGEHAALAVADEHRTLGRDIEPRLQPRDEVNEPEACVLRLVLHHLRAVLAERFAEPADAAAADRPLPARHRHQDVLREARTEPGELRLVAADAVQENREHARRVRARIERHEIEGVRLAVHGFAGRLHRRVLWGRRV
jgi:hypothetical protein